MRNFLKVAVLLAAVAPFAANAAVSTTLHNLSTTGTGTVKASAETQICKFCHTPHGANQQRAIWNHTATVQAFNWGAGNLVTTTGTTLPTTFSSVTLKCLSCHDGSVAIGSVANNGAGVAGTIAMNASTHLTAGALNAAAGANVVGLGGNLQGNHPTGIPYAGEPGSKAVAVAANGYYPVLAAGCGSASGVCINNGADGLLVNLVLNGAVRTVDCTSCHDPHGTLNTFLLLIPATSSRICLACHNQ